MKTGFAKRCITPPTGTPISGYYAPRYVKGVLDDLFARAVVFDDGCKQAAVIALDIVGMGQEYFERIKDAVVKKIGIEKDAIFINCSHTHTGPSLGDEDTGLISSESYIEFFVETVSDTVVYAKQDLKETKMSTASAQAKNISFVRRFRMKDGSVATNPGVNNPNIDHVLFQPNETVKLLKLEREDGDDIFVVNFGTHADTIGGEFISADYSGVVCSTIEKALPGTKCMFLLGCEGDVNHVNVNPTKGESAITKIDFDGVPRGIKHSQHMGRVIAGAVLSACSITEEVKSDKISYASKIVQLPSNQENDRIEEATKIDELYMQGRANELPYKEMELTTVVAEAHRIISLKDGPDYFEYNLSAVKVGDFVFAGIGGEVFTAIGNRILELSPYKDTMLCCITNNYGGYVPNKEAYDEGGYEVVSSNFKKGGDDVIVDGMIDMISKL